jgi:hypothetical protein
MRPIKLPKVREAPISCIAASSHRDRDRSPTHPVQIRAYSRTMHAFACSASEAINWQLPSCDPVEREKRGYGPHAGVASRAAPLLPAPRRHARVSINRPSTFEALSSQTIRSYVALTIPRAVAAMFARLETASVAGWMQSLGGNILHRIFQFGVSLMAFFSLFRDGRWLARRTTETVHIVFGGAGETLALRMLDTMRGIVTGSFAQVLLCGRGYIWLFVTVPGDHFPVGERLVFLSY